MAVAAMAALCILAGSAAAQETPQASTPLPWAYPLGPGAPRPDPAKSHQLPGSTETFAETQVRNAFNVADWYPGDHPSMPPIVKYGRRPEVRGCAYCHLPNGQGRPENAGIAGLPAEYIVQQIRDWKNGHRKSSEPKMGPPAGMLAIGKAVSFEDARVAADYFSKLTFKKWIRVVETETVPKTRVSGGMLIKDEAGGTEPIGQRIIEMPEDVERVELRDPRSGFVAYVPVGSIRKGETLVKTGSNGKTIQCATCHGQDLKGIGAVPPLAGRSPSYVVRQLWDMKQGNRNGPYTQLMKDVVDDLTIEDLVAIAAYTSSQNP
jgi:cytochrome c553